MTEYADRLVDKSPLKQYLSASIGFTDRFTVTYHPVGHSNETLFIDRGDREKVLRRTPPAETVDTAHGMLREYPIYEKLQDTSIPVPETVLTCEDATYSGTISTLWRGWREKYLIPHPSALRFRNHDAGSANVRSTPWPKCTISSTWP